MSFRDELNKAVKCADGFTMSVQANQGGYCSPRIDNAERYESVEVGYPSDIEPLLMPYCEDEEDPTGTVYGYVPSHVVTTVIAKHGGMVEGEVPAGVAPLAANSLEGS